MKSTPNLSVERYRLRGDFPMSSSRADGNNGAFIIPFGAVHANDLQVIVSDGLGWDHVSVVPVSVLNGQPIGHTPTWEEMCFVKGLFFESDECVVQYHPRASEYRNAHPHCLHLWRPQEMEIPVPDPEMVAPEPAR